MPRVNKLVAETEVGAEGTPHIQGYISFKSVQTMHNVERWLGGRVHLEAPRKNPLANYRYCTKDNTMFVQKGFDIQVLIDNGEKRKKQDANDRAVEILQDIQNLSRDEFIKKHASFYLYKRSIYDKFKCEAEMQQLENYEGSLKDKNYWVYGSAGSGKSRLATEWLPEENILRKTSNKWFDGFNSQVRLIVIDDLAPNLNEQTARTLKNLADRYKFVVEIKNSTIVITPRSYCLLITTNYTLEEIFQNEQDLEPIKRRFTFINMDDVVKFNGTVDPPKYLKEIYQEQPNPGSLSEALSMINTELSEVEKVDRELNEIKSQHEKNKKKLDQKEKRNKIKKRATFEESSDDISQTDWSDLSNPHPVFQGDPNNFKSDSDSDCQPWICPQRKYIPTEDDVVDFDEVKGGEASDEAEVTIISEDPRRNHSQDIKGDPLLEYLEKSDSE